MGLRKKELDGEFLSVSRIFFSLFLLREMQVFLRPWPGSGFIRPGPGYTYKGPAVHNGWIEQGPIDLSFIGPKVCWSTLLHCYLAYLKVYGT